jgi:DNA-binding response OmpR family regulator
VQRAGDLATAREALNHATFGLLVGDLGLPDGSGLDLVRELRSPGQYVPAVALSGYGMEHDVQQSRDAGFDAHVVKPVDADRLVDAIRGIVGVRG